MITPEYPCRVWCSGSLDSSLLDIEPARHFRCDFEAFRGAFRRDIPSRLLDLLEIGVAVSMIDRLLRRCTTESGGWHREIRVRFEVYDPDFWSMNGVQNAVVETLRFLTDDHWEIDFVERSRVREWTSSILSELIEEEPPIICLYSGGLDSAAGFAQRIRDNPNRTMIPVTVKHQPRQRKLIGKQYDILRERTEANIKPFVMRVGFGRSPISASNKTEPSQRARSFLFAAAGAVAAFLSGVAEVEVYESGVGAINVPLLPHMVGTSMATRGSHPTFYRLMSNLVSLVADRQIRFRLPFLDSTKGEMVRDLNRTGLADLARADDFLRVIQDVGQLISPADFVPPASSGDKPCSSPESTSRMEPIRLICSAESSPTKKPRIAHAYPADKPCSSL